MRFDSLVCRSLSEQVVDGMSKALYYHVCKFLYGYVLSFGQYIFEGKLSHYMISLKSCLCIRSDSFQINHQILNPIFNTLSPKSIAKQISFATPII